LKVILASESLDSLASFVGVEHMIGSGLYRTMKLYFYVGPRQLLKRVRSQPTGFPIRTSSDLLAWANASQQEARTGIVVATFVIDESGTLLLEDRRCEHVVCAGAEPVRSAGEITFSLRPGLEVLDVSNQSTGYCPEPESWPCVATALSQAGFEAPADFALRCDFRRCLKCDNITIVKAGIYECGVCGAELPASYNAQRYGS
jgi:hypothetical protein